jgi:hypothetical protein
MQFAYELQWRGDEPDVNQFRVLSTTVRQVQYLFWKCL